MNTQIATAVRRILATSAEAYSPSAAEVVSAPGAGCALVGAFDAENDSPVSRERVLELEEALKSLPPAEAPVTHHFAPGVYLREMLIPKHTILTGKIHRHAHMNIVLKGDISVLTEHGVKRIQGPCVLMSGPGIKRAGFAHEDTIWLTVHQNPNDERDLEKLEAQHIAPSFAEFEGLAVAEDKLCLGEQ